MNMLLDKSSKWRSQSQTERESQCTLGFKLTFPFANLDDEKD